MNISALEAILLFAFSIPVVMGYRILPIEGTPYWLFGILFLILTSNIIFSLYPPVQKKIPGIARDSRNRISEVLLWIVIAIVVGGTTMTAIVDRAKTAPVYGVHDIILQQEAAMRYLLSGKNPYKETYFGTAVEEFNYDEPGDTRAINPALYHFVMPPWYLLFPFSIYFVSIPLLGYFDGRMALLVTMVGLLIVLWKWFKHRPLALLAVTLTALSPAVIDYFIEGRSDIFALFWFVWSLFLLEKKRLFWSAVIFGLALMSKQTIWFSVPFLAAYLWFVTKNLRKIVSFFTVSGVMVLALASPFLLWDPKAFIDSTIRFLSGTTQYNYPISGYGLGMVLNQLGIIRDIHAYYPFIIWQIVLGVPVLVMSLWWLSRKPMTSKVFIGYALTLSLFWYLSRYFNNSHIGYISSLFVLGILKSADEETV